MRNSELLLVGESFSPWTKKARWALEYCGLKYDYKEYTPTLSEPGLRWRLRQFTGKVSVPILFTGKDVFRGSWEIAGFANQTTGKSELGDFQDIEPWNELSERALEEGRTRLVRQIMKNEKALIEGLPPFIPAPLRRLMRGLSYDAVKRLDRKYAHLVKPGSLKNALIKTRERLATTKNDYLLERFSYADMTMAAVLEVIAPIAQHEPPLGPATASCWYNEALAEEFSDLIEWRNRLASDPKTSYSQFNHLIN